MDSMNTRTVQKLLDRYGYYFYVIKVIPDTVCPCTNLISNSPDPNCKKCLGTGQRIKIYKVFGSLREGRERESNSTGNITVTPKIAYIKGLYRIDRDDIVIDNEDVYHVLTTQHHKGEHGEFAFTRLVLPYTKNNPAPLIRNFKELLNEYNLRKKKK